MCVLGKTGLAFAGSPPNGLEPTVTSRSPTRLQGLQPSSHPPLLRGAVAGSCVDLNQHCGMGCRHCERLFLLCQAPTPPSTFLPSCVPSVRLKAVRAFPPRRESWKAWGPPTHTGGRNGEGAPRGWGNREPSVAERRTWGGHRCSLGVMRKWCPPWLWSPAP